MKNAKWPHMNLALLRLPENFFGGSHFDSIENIQESVFKDFPERKF